jgi:hypothetical protein
MKYLIITIEIPVDETRGGLLTLYEAKESAKQAYKSARKALQQFTLYNEDDFSFKIEE